MRLYTLFLLSLAQGNAYDASKDGLYRAYLLFTILGVIAGIGGIIAIYLQTKATKKAAEATAQAAQATQAYVKLQEIGLRQWVKTSDWKTQMVHPISHPEQLTIDFVIVNPTSAPITLMWARITTPGGNMSVAGFPQNAMLIPETPYTVDVEAELTPSQQRSSYLSSTGLILPVEGSIAYTDALKDKWEQRFTLKLICSRTNTTTSEYIHTLHPVTDAR